MLANLLISFLITLAPTHDFHTSWMNMTYDEESKEFETTWRTDTEHLEGVLSAFSEQEITLESTSIETHKTLINKYISSNTSLRFNGKEQDLAIAIIEVTFAEVIIHFKPIKCRRKLKTVSMENSLLQAQFPNRKNMVQINYKGEMHSMLLGGLKVYEEVIIN